MLTTQVNIYDWNDQLVTTTVFQLMQWEAALRLELKTGMAVSRGKKMSTHLRKVLSAPRSYSVQELHGYIKSCLDEVKAQIDDLTEDAEA